MKIDNDLIEEMTKNISDFNLALERENQGSNNDIVSDELMELLDISTRRSEIRKSLGFDLYLLYYDLSCSLMEEDYETASIIRDKIKNF
ncbi:MAG: hypothetical protein SLAVMIC_00277 [uncultured marine phage]|uniref:Uncharacterized protein n=1 Tax=uncultured marine phage TaxID=707152 RepID=A0A8D9CCS7_9VIRU|nr:MAG: hypothetical protein SLAVMIC_00277 [uncultured marine phage]